MWTISKIVKKGDYLYAVVKDHPSATKHGYVLLHRIVAENMIGRLLEKTEIVHHKNGNKKDNREENLEIMDRIKHCKKHASDMKAAIVWYLCPNCGKEFFRRTGKSTKYTRSKSAFCSRYCNGSFSRRRQIYGDTDEILSALEKNFLREEIVSVADKQGLVAKQK